MEVTKKANTLRKTDQKKRNIQILKINEPYGLDSDLTIVT